MKAVPALASLTVIVLGTPAIALASTVGSDPASFGQKNMCAERSVVHPSVNGSRVPPLSSTQTVITFPRYRWIDPPDRCGRPASG
jgi:hypothetical protein